VRRDSSYIFLTVKRTVKLLTFRLCVLNVEVLNGIKRSPCKRYINLTGISNLMKERSANYKCCKLPEMLPT
jgi:hypothetical protein